MRLILLTILILASFASAQSAGLLLESNSYNFGTVKEGAVINHEFVYYNRGRREIKIEDVVASCGCTIAEVSRKVLAPGDRGVIRASFDTDGFSGNKVKTIQVITNDPGQQVYEFTLLGKVVRDVEIEPSALLFGEVYRGEKVSRTLKVVTESGVKLLSAKSRAEQLELTVEENKIDVSFLADMPIGTFRDRIVVRTNSKKNPVLVVPTIARVVGEVYADPPELSFGLLEGPLKEAQSLRVRLVNRAEEPIVVSGAESENSELDLKLETFEEGRLYFLTVTLEEGFLGSLNSAIKVETDKKRANFTIPVAALAVERE